VAVPTTGLFPPYGALGTNACSSCHRSHSMPAAAGPRLLRVPEESACTLCHSAGSGVSAPDVEAEFNKPYAHPTLTVSGAHDPAEAAFPLNDPPTTRHAECADCHQPHATLQGPGSQNPPDVEPALTGASGYDGTAPLRPALREYEICFKCHANSTNKPQNNPGFAVFGRTPVRRADALAADAHDLLEKFSSATARHNVTQARRLLASQLPSLRTFILNPNGSQGRSLAAGTFIYCTDCHSSDQSPRTGGNGTDGPHGSLYPHILTRRYEAETLPVTAGASSPGVPYVPGTNGTAGLCDKCHDIEGSILHNDSFKEHDKHVRGEDASCSTCHDPHGVGAAPAANHSSLVNFDISIVAPSSSGLLRFERTGAFSGRCYLTCHGQNHNPESY